MSGGGSGGSGTQKYEWNENIAPHWQNALDYASALKDKPYNPYPYQRIAGLTGDQTNAMGLVRQMTGQGGTSTAQAANNQAEDTLNDRYLYGAGANPAAQQENQFQGNDNPYFRSVMNQGAEDIASKYLQGTSADTTRMFNMAGAFGGSAHQQAMQNNQAQLGKTLSQYTQGMQNDQYNRSAAMDESRLGRVSGAYEGERGRQMSAVNPGQNANNMFYQGIQQLMGIGDINRSHTQDQYNQAYNDWQQQQNYPASQLDYYTGILGRAQGGVSPNVVSQQSGYAASPYSQILGAGLLGYGMMNR